MVDGNGEISSQEKQLLQKLDLIRVGFYPDHKNSSVDFAIFDYSLKIDEEYSNYVLVVRTSENGQFSSLTYES